MTGPASSKQTLAAISTGGLAQRQKRSGKRATVPQLFFSSDDFSTATSYHYSATLGNVAIVFPGLGCVAILGFILLVVQTSQLSHQAGPWRERLYHMGPLLERFRGNLPVCVESYPVALTDYNLRRLWDLDLLQTDFLGVFTKPPESANWAGHVAYAEA